MKTANFFLSALYILLLWQAAAAETPQTLNIDGDEFQITRNIVRWQTLPVNHRVIQGIQIGHDSLDALRKKLGQAESQMVGRDEYFCYESAAKTSKERLVFNVWGKEVLGAYLMAKKSAGKFEGIKCAKSAKVKAKSATTSGLKLGLSKQGVKKVLGSPSIARGNDHYYIYESEEGDRFLFTGLKISFEKNRLARLYVFKSMLPK